jgi:ribonuclease P protein component
MFPRSERVTSLIFQEVIKKGRRLRSDHFSVHFISISDLKKAKISVVATKKASNKAVDRNRLKRQTREYIKNTILKNKPLPGNLAVLVFIHFSWSGRLPAAYALELQILFKQIR